MVGETCDALDSLPRLSYLEKKCFMFTYQR